MSYLVLARKYRPQRFEEIVAQEHVSRTLQNAVKNASIPFHSGAIKYYKEKGVWTDELERLQKDLLGPLGDKK